MLIDRTIIFRVFLLLILCLFAQGQLFSEQLYEISETGLISQAYPEMGIISFFDRLYQDYQNAIEEKFGDDLDLELLEFDDIGETNREELLKLYFFHKLFTCSSCIDGNNTGILQIPYFWHWVKPNPRYEIVLLPDSLCLTEIKPPAEYDLFKTFADIDRTPLLFLNDLFSDNVEYYHPDCGNFKTFGWCSEREMAFNIILKLYGYECKVVASGNHSWSEFYASYKHSEAETIRLVIEIDNTFDGFRIRKFPLNFSLSEWKKEQGTSNLAKWYNDKANDSDVLNKFKTLRISTNRATELNEMVRKYFYGNLSGK